MKTAKFSLAAAALLLALALGCGSSRPGYPYSWNDLRLISSYTAKTACSCLFVMEFDEAACRAYAKQEPPIATWTVDRNAKTVDASTGLMWGARARYMGPKFGCTLE